MGQSQAAHAPGSSAEGFFASLALLMSSQLVVQPPSWLPSPQGSHSLLANLLLTFLLPYLFFFFFLVRRKLHFPCVVCHCNKHSGVQLYGAK